MNSREMLEQLEALAQRMSIKVRYEKCKSRGGLCRIKGEQMIIIRKDLTVQDKADLFSRLLCRFPLEDYYLIPEVRKILEQAASSIGKDGSDVLEEFDELEEEFADGS